MHKHRNSVLQILFVIALCLIFNLNLFGAFTLKLQETSTRRFVHICIYEKHNIIVFSKCLLRHDVVSVFVSFCVLVFVRAILSWCP